MTYSPLRMGLIGTGRIGQVHAAAIAANPNTLLARVADPVLDSAQRIVRLHGGTATTDAGTLFTAGDLDAILVASPTTTHIEFIVKAVDARIPVLCEKPIDLDMVRVNEIRDKVAASGVPVAVGFNRRFDPAFANARARVRDGEIGQLEQLIIISRDPAPPPAAYLGGSGGIFRDMTIHDFDMARFFAPSIVEVSAVGSNTFDSGARDHGDFDTAVVTLRSASGAVVTVINSRHSAVGYDQRIEAFGPLGMIQVANMPTSLVSVSTGAAVGASAPFEPFFLERYKAAYAAELEDFVRLVRGEESTCPTFEDGRAALLLADAAQQSATKRVVVPVDAF